MAKDEHIGTEPQHGRTITAIQGRDLAGPNRAKEFRWSRINMCLFTFSTMFIFYLLYSLKVIKVFNTHTKKKSFHILVLSFIYKIFSDRMNYLYIKQNHTVEV